MTKLYLVTVLIELHGQTPIDSHILCTSLDKAKEVLKTEIHTARNQFPVEPGVVLTSNDYCHEWRDNDGYGYTVGIEEMTPVE